MDDWRQSLLVALLPKGATRDATLESLSALEGVMASARAEVAYLIEMGRHLDLPIMGGTTGNDVWVRLGHPLLRFVLDRPGNVVRFISAAGESSFRWDAEKRALVDADGARADFSTAMRKGIEALVEEWQSSGEAEEEAVGPTSEHPTMA